MSCERCAELERRLVDAAELGEFRLREIQDLKFRLDECQVLLKAMYNRQPNDVPVPQWIADSLPLRDLG
jgi:hypothetical protein